MRTHWFVIPLAAALGGCPSSTEPAAEAPAAEAPAAEAPAEAPAAEAPAAEAPAAEAPAAEAPAAPAAGSGEAAAPAADTFENGVYSTPRFNVRFTLPEGWRRVGAEGEPGVAGLGTSDDSITFVGPGDIGLRLVVANSESIQLVDASFSNLTETIGFDNVRIVPDRTQARTFNGIPGYRTEADALLRGEPVPQYIIAQALDLPGKPTMFTIFVNGDQYDLQSATMKAILDSIEVLDIRPQ